VVTMSSGVASYGRIRFDDLQWKRGYRPNLAYAQSSRPRCAPRPGSSPGRVVKPVVARQILRQFLPR
jgi:hypothetical protein